MKSLQSSAQTLKGIVKPKVNIYKLHNTRTTHSPIGDIIVCFWLRSVPCTLSRMTSNLFPEFKVKLQMLFCMHLKTWLKGLSSEN
jgi:hypothetical protein